MKPIIVGISGASGSVLARAAIDELLRRDVPTVAVCSNGAKLVWQEEMEESFNTCLAGWQENPNFCDCDREYGIPGHQYLCQKYFPRASTRH